MRPLNPGGSSSSSSAASAASGATKCVVSNSGSDCVGSGFSGLGAAVALRKIGIEDFVLLEREATLGGTWVQHDYPGLEVDMPFFIGALDVDSVRPSQPTPKALALALASDV